MMNDKRESELSRTPSQLSCMKPNDSKNTVTKTKAFFKDEIPVVMRRNLDKSSKSAF